MAGALSIVVCTHNHADSLAATLRALAAQDADPASFDVTVVNNRCTDHTSSVVAAAGVREVLEPIAGQVHARVRGVRESGGEWVAFVDDDNLPARTWVSEVLRFAGTHPGCGAFGGVVELEYETPPPSAVAQRAYAYAATDLPGGVRRLEGDERWRLRGAGLVCRRQALEDAGWLGWQANVGRAGSGTMAGDDTEIVMRIARAGWELWYAPACRLRHVISAGRLTVDHLRSLHRGFAAADPILLGFRESGGSISRWARGCALLLAKRGYWLARHAWRGWRDADSRLTARLTLDTLVGNLSGFPAAIRLCVTHRRAWLEAPATLPRNPAAMRVLHLHNANLYGGLERMLSCLGADRAECPQMEPVFGLGHRHRLAGELAAAGARVEILGPMSLRRPWQAALALLRLRSLLRRETFHAVVCHGSAALALLGRGIADLGAPVVFWMHSDTKTRNKNFVERLAGGARPRLVICNSAYTAASLPLLLPACPPHVVVHCPVPRPVSSGAVATRRAALRAEFGTPDDAAVVILPSRLEGWKGHGLLLEALARLRDLPAWHCWIVGGPCDAEQERFLGRLSDQAMSLGISERVVFCGQRADVPELLAAADIFCQPNLTPEPFGVNVIEALYAGLPVVASDSGGTREIVDATCGRLVPPGDVSALTAEMDRLIRDEAYRRSLGAGGAARAEAIASPARLLPVLHDHLVRVASSWQATVALPAGGLDGRVVQGRVGQ